MAPKIRAHASASAGGEQGIPNCPLDPRRRRPHKYRSLKSVFSHRLGGGKATAGAAAAGGRKAGDNGGDRTAKKGGKVSSSCSECGRQFLSEKALFGHMRSHGDRPWRGLHPPPGYRRPSVKPRKESPPAIEPAAEGDGNEADQALAVDLARMNYGGPRLQLEEPEWESAKGRRFAWLLHVAAAAAAAYVPKTQARGGFDLNHPSPPLPESN